LAELREKLAEKRAAQTKVDAKEAKANEAIRRKAGQVSSNRGEKSIVSDHLGYGKDQGGYAGKGDGEGC